MYIYVYISLKNLFTVDDLEGQVRAQSAQLQACKQHELEQRSVDPSPQALGISPPPPPPSQPRPPHTHAHHTTPQGAEERLGPMLYTHTHKHLVHRSLILLSLSLSLTAMINKLKNAIETRKQTVSHVQVRSPSSSPPPFFLLFPLSLAPPPPPLFAILFLPPLAVISLLPAHTSSSCPVRRRSRDGIRHC